MDTSLNNSILTNISNLIKDNTLDFSKNIKVLNVFYDNKISLYPLKELFPNIEIYDYQVVSPTATHIETFESISFDYIVLNEILEKLINVNDFVNNLRNILTINGVIISNTLNIMHLSVVKNLLHGKFTYDKSGILNKNNLRFYTLQEIKDLFDDCRYDLDKILAIVLNLSEEENNLIEQLCNLTTSDLKLNYSCYSYIFSAKIKNIKTLYDYVLN
ncbi:MULTISPECIES: hypothetical protein [Peptostreptococcaceae]|uniref:hypothetical protein n=1 Tax=Peptostreptococcaceae TaxID=186804 RepID=UPI003F2A1EDD